MKAKHNVWKNKLVKTMSLVTAILVAALFFGTAAGAGIAHKGTPTEKTNISATSKVDVSNANNVVSIGRAPWTSTPTAVKNPLRGEPLSEPFYAVNDDADMFCSFEPSNPGTFTNIGSATPTGFIQNAVAVLDVYWVIDQYGTLYTVDVTTGAFTTVGPTGVTDTMGLAYDDTTGQMFMTAGTYTAGNLYQVDMGTGQATLIGNLGEAGFAMISIVCDNDGQLYGAEIVGAGSPGMFYSIDKTTGAATQIGSVGFSMNYGQDMEYDKDNDILYFCAFNYDTFMPEFRTIDKTTGMSTLVGNLPGQTTGFGILYESQTPLDHDISVSSIMKPATGNAAPIEPIVKVKNSGLNTEYNVDIQTEISKIVISDQWSVYNPSGGNTWVRSTSGQHTGSGCAKCTYEYTALPNDDWLVTPGTVVASGGVFSFWVSGYTYDDDTYHVYMSTVGNTIDNFLAGTELFSGVAHSGYALKSFDMSAYVGQTVYFGILYDGNYAWYIWVDDVTLPDGSFEGFESSVFPPTAPPSYVLEYDQTVTIAQIDPDQVIDVVFPEWTPADLMLTENVNIGYRAEATNLFIDENVNNDYKAKPFTLHYGYFNDVKVNEIVSPVSGLAESQIPEVIIENVGQLDEVANVEMVISKINYGAQWTQVQHSGQGLWERWEGYSYVQPTYGSGAYMIANSDGHSGQMFDVSIYTGSMDLTGETSVTFSCAESFQDLGYDDTARISILSGGVSQGDAYYQVGIDDPYGGGTVSYTFDPSAFPDPSDVQVEFYYSTGSGTWDWGFAIDNVLVQSTTVTYLAQDFENPTFPPAVITLVPEYDTTQTVGIAAGETLNVVFDPWYPADLPVLMNIDYQADVTVTLNGMTPIFNYGFEDAWIPYVPPGPVTFPPAGWTVINANADTVLWTQYTSPHAGTYCASIGYHYPTDDDWLTTQPVIVPGGGGMFSFWWKCGSTYYAEHFKIYYSTSGNTIADFTGANGHLIGDITYNTDVLWHQFTYAMTSPEQVWFAVYCLSADALRLSVDDFAFPDGSTQGFDTGGTPAILAHPPGWTQTQYGTSSTYSNLWASATVGSYPTCYPPEGAQMAFYNSFSTPSGSNLLLKNVPLDLTASSGYIMSFQMYHNWGYYNASADRVYAIVSPDGVSLYGAAFYRYDGTVGWATHSMDISAFAGDPTVWVGFYAISAYGDNMFVDDMQISSLGAIPDGNPADNTMSKIFTLSYEHDVGVVGITQPAAPPKRDVIWDNYADDGTGVGLSSQLDVVNFNSQMADDFQFTATMDVNEVHWWGAFWNGVTYPNPAEFNVIFYADDGSGNMPTGAGMDDPTSTALAVYNFPAVTGTSYGANKYEYDVTLDPAFVADAGQKYWIAIQEVADYTIDGQWGWSSNGDNNPDQLHQAMQGFPLLGYPYWTDPGYGDEAFQLGGQEHQQGGGGWYPGTYQVAGIVQNLGVTYDESNFDVNTQIKAPNGTIFYDYTVTVPDVLAPGAMATVYFPDFVIEDHYTWEGKYTLTMKTMLPDDAHTNNDKKTMTFDIIRDDVYPPITNYSIAGTMGQNGWYISNPVVTLAAYDPQGKAQSGVNHTYYIIDSGAQNEYTAPFTVPGDGTHVVKYWSVDKAGNAEAQHTSPSFKVDTTPPVFTEYTFTAQNAMKNKWLCEADVDDATSGIVLVEFYVDDALVGNATTAPYEFLYEGKATNSSQAIAYDAAGNSALSAVASYYEFNSQSQPIVQLVLQKLI